MPFEPHIQTMTDEARAVARVLSYGGDAAEAKAKHLLLEMAHALDRRNVGIVPLQGRPVVRDGLWRHRPLTLRERLLWRLFGAVPADPTTHHNT